MLSVICGCMNRQAMLAQTLPTWLALPGVDEVVIVDWSSTIPLIDWISTLGDKRVIVARVEGQEHWIASKCFNLAFSLGKGDDILKLDTDYLLRPGFLEFHQKTENSFYCGHRLSNNRAEGNHLIGALYVDHEDFEKVNGYNERILTYGYEDGDLYDRLEKTGLERKKFDYSLIEHIPHSNDVRMKYHMRKNMFTEIFRNSMLANDHPWLVTDNRIKWTITKISHNFLLVV